MAVTSGQKTSDHGSMESLKVFESIILLILKLPAVAIYVPGDYKINHQ